MRSIRTSTFIPYLFLALSMFFGTALFAQEGEASTEEKASKEITQGQAAVLLVRRLGLWHETGSILTQNEAISRLDKLNIAPLGGWNPDSLLNMNELTRMLAQALELDTDFSEAEKSDPEAKAHKEALVAQYNLDMDDLVGQLARNRAQIPTAVGRIPDSTESDPVTKPNPPETDGFIPTVEEFVVILLEVTGGVSDVSSPSQNITPSAP